MMILTGLLALPLFFIGPIFFLKKDFQVKVLSLVFSLMYLVYGVFVLSKFDMSLKIYQMIEVQSLFKPMGLHYALGVDGLSLLLILLSLFLMPLIILGTWNSIRGSVKTYFVSLFLLQTCMLGTFLSIDLLLFFFFFESSLIPMLLLMGVYGGRERIFAAKKFFMFTFVGSILLLGAIVTMIVLYTSIHGVPSSLMAELQSVQLPFIKNTLFSTQTILFFGFFFAFAVKAPLFPFHTWLPDAHVEAPTGGSVILAGLMLKMGTYGMLRFLSLYFPQASEQYSWVVCTLAIIGIVYGAMVAFAQTDIKKLIAYSSVSHMGYIVLGIFCWNSAGHLGATFQMVSHGLSTGALFLMIGMLYERFKTREISSFGGLAEIMPNFTICFVLLSFASIAVPLTNGFVGEFLILLGAYKANPYYAIFAVTGVFLSASYMLNMIRKVFFGICPENFRGLKGLDLSKREFTVLAPIIILIFVTGVYPQSIISFISESDVKLESGVDLSQTGEEVYVVR